MVDLEKLRILAKETISREDVKYLIGWKEGTYGFAVSPCFITDPAEVDGLIFSPLCTNNLATYLTLTEKLPVPRGQEPDSRKVALLVKGCDSRAVVQQLVEQGISRDSMVVIGCPCRGVVDTKKAEELWGQVQEPVQARWNGDSILVSLPDGEKEVKREKVLASNCLTCRYPNPVVYDALAWEEVEPFGRKEYEEVQELENMSPEKRWEYWEEQFSNCIRCYSCRNVCPLCYCQDCVLDRLNPTWVNRSVNGAENTFFQVARAFHLAGRCAECGECERVCPVNIPLMRVNQKLAKEVREKYEFEPGLDPEAKPFQASYRPDDKEDFIL